jgi:hypothetical protein
MSENPNPEPETPEPETPDPDEVRDVVAAPPAVDAQDDEAPEESAPATLEDQDNGDRNGDAADPLREDASDDDEERRTDGDVGGTVDDE